MWPFIDETYIHPSTKNLVKICPLVLEKVLLYFANVFSLFLNYIPWKRWALDLNKLEFPLPKDDLCQIWLKLAQWFYRRFFKFVNLFTLLSNYLPLEVYVGHNFDWNLFSHYIIKTI